MKHVGDLTIPKIAALYAQVPPDRLAEFQAFRQSFPYQDMAFDKVTWSYLDGGEGDPPLLLLSGALTIPDISLTTITAMAAQRRVIVPAYPPVMTMDVLADGIAAVLQHAGVDQAHVMGGSYGGFVAQVFVRRHPEMARSLVLSHTQPPYPEMAPRMRRFVRLLHWLPAPFIHPLLRRTFQSMMPERTDDTALLLAIFDELVAHTLGKQDVIGILARMVDFSTRPFDPGDLGDWPGSVLLISGEEDRATPPDVRQRLEALYPGCRVHLFEGSGHTTSVTHQKTYLDVVNGFISQS